MPRSKDRVVNQNAMRLLPGAEYLELIRVRGLLMREMARIMWDIDGYVVPFDYADYTPNPVAPHEHGRQQSDRPAVCSSARTASTNKETRLA